MSRPSRPNSALRQNLIHSKGEATDAFLNAFFVLDSDNNEVIDLKHLKKYNEKHSLSNNFPENFLHLFDSEDTGTITLETYCQKLGLIPTDVRALRKKQTSLLLEQIMPPDLRIICDEIEVYKKYKIMSVLLEPMRKAGATSNVDMRLLDDAVHLLKISLEARHGKSWHIVISINQHLARFSFIPKNMLHFTYGRFAVLIWKTPYVD